METVIKQMETDMENFNNKLESFFDKNPRIAISIFWGGWFVFLLLKKTGIYTGSWGWIVAYPIVLFSCICITFIPIFTTIFLIRIIKYKASS